MNDNYFTFFHFPVHKACCNFQFHLLEKGFCRHPANIRSYFLDTLLEKFETMSHVSVPVACTLPFMFPVQFKTEQQIMIAIVPVCEADQF